MIYITQNNKQTVTTITLMSREACKEGVGRGVRLLGRSVAWFDAKSGAKYFV